MHPAFIWILGVTAAVTALVGFWKKVLIPLASVIYLLDKNGPALLKMAAELTPNGGGSIKDKIDKMHIAIGIVQQDMEHVKKKNAFDVDEVSKQLLSLQTIVRRNHRLSEKYTKDLAEQTTTIEKYVHERFHALSNRIQELALEQNLSNKQMKFNSKTLDSLVKLKDDVEEDIRYLKRKTQERRGEASDTRVQND